jgi:iron complex transport system substrate-binding protein
MKALGVKFLWAFAAALLLLSCAAEAETITFTDKLGRVVSIPVPVGRAVLFQMYELVPAFGVWDKIVGIGRYAYDNDLMKAAKPDIATAIPSVGTGIDVNMEALLTLKPDIVITWTFKPDAVKFMEEKGLKVIAVSPDNLAELYEVIRLQGKLFGKEDRAEAVIQEMEKIFALVTRKVSKIPSQSQQKVLWLFSKPTLVAAGTSVSNNLIEMIRGINPASGAPQTNSDVSIEQIIAWNPDVIFIWGHAGYTAESILESAQWRRVRAVMEHRVYKAPQWSNWSPGVATVVLWMAVKTYPDSFKDVNFELVCDGFYREVYGIPFEKVSRIEQ